MNSIHSSKLIALALVACLLAQGAVALTVDGDDPGEVEVSTELDHTVTVEELHQNPQIDSWTLEAGTELEDPQWTITYLDQAGEEIEKASFEDANITSDQLSTENNVDAMEIRVRGTVPSIEEHTYPDSETVLVMELLQVPDNGVTDDIATIEAQPYTEESRTARENLDAAREAIERANANGADVSSVTETYDSAVSSYQNGNFENANRLAKRATENANGKVESSEQTQTILYAAGGAVVLVLVVGGFFWYRSRQDTYDKLG